MRMHFNKESLYKISISTKKILSALLNKFNPQYCQITYISMQIYIFQNKYLSVNEFSQNIYHILNSLGRSEILKLNILCLHIYHIRAIINIVHI